ncbi:hypothetical protein [Stutzerimonas urumqiensis]|uniref:hypothetical protein n=1 Tax=Stutzerimonas urumqiensis TaxID=638269 RepID=UPI001C497EC7|nr:hypothetical protein [Stutzerimonas urumqiensis]
MPIPLGWTTFQRLADTLRRQRLTTTMTTDAARDADRREIKRLRELIAHNSDWL